MTSIDVFNKEVDCLHEGERYLVRDNGAVFRFPPFDKPPRVYDNQWTFGIPNSKNFYLEIASVPIHQIIAKAFHGPRPTKSHVVDHINADIRNNCPDNLRWLVNLDNILLSPITAKRIAKI